MLRFKIYYGDGSTYEGSGTEDAWKAPSGCGDKGGVQIVKQEADNERGFTLRHGCTFFCWEETPVQRWSGKQDEFGLADYLLYTQGPQRILLGREIHDDTYQNLSRRAVEEGGWK